MKKAASYILLLASLLVPALGRAVAAPANLAVGAYQQNATAQLYWDEDTSVTQWFVLFDGKVAYQPLRSQTGLTSTARRSFLMTNIAPARLPVVISMQAMAPGQPLSVASAGVTLTSTAPPGGGIFVYNDSTHPLFISGTAGGGGGGDATAANQVTGNNSLAAINSTLNAMSGSAAALQSAVTGGVPLTSTAQYQYASLTFTATGGAVNGATVVSAVSGKTISVVGYNISTDTAASIVLHHQSGAVSLSNSSANIIGGGVFPANGGEVSPPGMWRPGLAQNQPVTVDVSGAVTKIYVFVTYTTY